MLKKINLKFASDAALIEFWIVTGCFIISLSLSLYDVRHNQSAAETIMPILFSFLVTFILYLLLSFYLGPAFESDNKSALNGSLFIFLFLAICFLVGIISIYFTALLALKILFIYFNRNRANSEGGLYFEAALLTASWILIAVGLLYLSTPLMLRFYLILDIPVAIVLYLYAVYGLLSRYKIKNAYVFIYLLRMLAFAILSCIAVYFISTCFTGNNAGLVRPLLPGVLIISMGDEDVQNLVLCNFATQLVVVTPLAVLTYKRRTAVVKKEINLLKTELGQSDANLNFLKSQINPHFLFNALNTLYGTALQESARRTGEGIQKLGDMMRFMLDENVKDTIALSRDIDYLNNYILLQKLRTATSSSVTIETQVEDYQGELNIAPMLLIPFVENAFKYGISLQYPSFINVFLEIKDNKIYFDVHNSIHLRAEIEGEMSQSGIGLENVKQRLVLLYPSRHDLVIRENTKEFFVHLTIELANNNNNNSNA